MSDEKKKTPLFQRGLDRAIEFVAPSWGVQRMVSRQKIEAFSYDAAHKDGKRGSSGGMAKNASPESPIIQRDRVELMWDARSAEKNMPVMSCVLDRMEQYAVGTLLYRPDTGDAEMDRSLQGYVESWMENFCDLAGRHDFRTMTGLVLRSALRDGDIGGKKVAGEYLQLQLIEADRIGDPSKLGVNDSEKYTAGMHLDPDSGRVLAYDVFKRDKNNRYTQDGDSVPSEEFLHIFRPTRADQYRGITWFAQVLPQARDLYEAFQFERGAAKWAASYAGVIRVADRSRTATGPAQWDGTKVDGTSTQEVKANTLLKLKDNEDVTPFPPSNRPSGAFMAYIEASLKDIAMGLNVPYGFLDMMGFSGANSRLETMQVQRTIARYQKMLVAKWLNPVIRDVINNGVAKRHLLPPRNEQARQAMYFADWRFGAHITADVGYQAQSDVLMLNNGLTTAGALIDQYGGDYEDTVDRLAQEAAYLREAATRAGVPIELIMPIRFPAASDLIGNYEASLRPPPPPTVATVGDKATGQIIELLIAVATGQMPREQAIATLVNVYNTPPDVAKKIVPEQNSGEAPEAKAPVDSNKKKK